MDINSEGVLVSSTFRLLLNRMRHKKLSKLKTDLASVSNVEHVEMELNFYHAFDARGRRLGRRIVIPTNGLGVAKMTLLFEDEVSISFHTVSTFGELGYFMSGVAPYMSDSKFSKSFSVEETETQNYIIFKVQLTDNQEGITP